MFSVALFIFATSQPNNPAGAKSAMIVATILALVFVLSLVINSILQARRINSGKISIEYHGI